MLVINLSLYELIISILFLNLVKRFSQIYNNFLKNGKYFYINIKIYKILLFNNINNEIY